MISFIFSVFLLILGYVFYGAYVDRCFGPDERKTPANSINDGVDYVPLPTWKVWLIQLLNIAGTGPIFGALAGALFGPVVYLWIVFGSIFAGGVHDYMSGVLSERNNGKSISEVAGAYLGSKALIFMRLFSVILLLFCGIVFTIGPAALLDLITNKAQGINFWFWIILAYYFIATFVPVDKIIGKCYPIFGACLLLMAFGVSFSLLFSENFQMPEVWNHFTNYHPKDLPVWPFMFISVACGAISGFHATQSPIMSRCITSEKDARKVFYGAMITEGFIALVWAAAGVTCFENSQALLNAGAGQSSTVYQICTKTMGSFGSILALLGVVACPITSGDTAYRSARLTIADSFNIDQSNWKKRLAVTLPLLLAGYIIGQQDYSIIWRYFSWSNQTLAMVVLWSATVYLKQNKKNYMITLVPAFFMTALTSSYFFTAPECCGLILKHLEPTSFIVVNNYWLSITLGLLIAFTAFFVFISKTSSKENKE